MAFSLPRGALCLSEYPQKNTAVAAAEARVIAAERIRMQLESNKPPESGQLRDPRVYLATERTFLAWIRTGLALMGFGFVVARFGLFLQQIQLVNHALAAQP